MQNDHILKKKMASAQPPQSIPGALTHAFKLKSRLICFISIATLPACKISAKILTIALVIAKCKYLSLSWGQRGWGKTLTLPCLSTGTGQSCFH